MKYCFTVDDNIRFLKELTQQQPEDMFSHPYLAMYRRLHEAHGVKVQLNLFYEMPGFTLSQMTDRYREQWQANAHWLKLSFHSRLENVRPYESSGYDEVFSDCAAVHREILRFAGPDSLGKTTTIHYCRNTVDNMYCIEFTSGSASAKTYTAIWAELVAARKLACTDTVMNTLVYILFLGKLMSTGAHNLCAVSHMGFSRCNAYDFRNFVAHIL